MKLKITIVLLLTIHFATAQDRLQKVDSLLQAMFAEKKINGNFLIAEKGQVIYNKSFGLANETTMQPLNHESIFELASVSKAFTAMGIAILKEKGKLSFEDKMAKYIPELAAYDKITIRQLLNHTGGLPDYMSLMDTVFDKSKIATNKDMIEIFAKQNPKVLFEPNTKFEYSNTGYAILASIIERISGKTFEDFMLANIFKPLKMNNTFVYNRRWKPKKVDNYAYGYVYDHKDKKYRLPDDVAATKMVVWLDGIVGDGIVNSTVNDLLKWDRALYTDKLLPYSSMKEIFGVPTLNNGTKTQYGFGWFIENNADFGQLINHSGGWPGYATFIDRHIDQDKTIIILQNHNDIQNPIQSIRRILYNKPLPTTPVGRKEVKLPIEKLKKLLGVYKMQNVITMTISLENDQLFARLAGQDALPIFAETETQFFLKVVNAQLQFVKNDDGEISGLILLQNGKKLTFDRSK